MKIPAIIMTGLIPLLLTGCWDGPAPSNNTTGTGSLSAPSQTYAAINGPTAEIPITVASLSQSGPLRALASSSSITVSNIQVAASSIPAGITIQYQNADHSISNTNCTAIQSGQTCTLLLTGTGSGTSGNYTLVVTATNAPSISIPLNLQWPSLTLTTNALTNSRYTLLLTNASQVTASDISYTLPTTPSGWRVDTSVATCTAGQSLTANASCILAEVTDATAGDPTAYDITANGSNLEGSELLYGFSPYCTKNINNFTTEISESPYYTPPGDNNILDGVAWGPFPFRPIGIDSNILSCSANSAWQVQRALATAQYWIDQKVNYCHHHISTWLTPTDVGGVNYQNGNNCSITPDILSGPHNNELIRWNYSGTGNETAHDWQHTKMWHGLDCSDYTALIFNFGMQAPLMDTSVAEQAGQACPQTNPQPGCSTWITTLTPNQQTINETLFSPEDINKDQNVGAWVCADGTTDRTSYSGTSNFCGNFGGTDHDGYISVVNKAGQYNENAITPAILDVLKPGDLLYFGIGPYNSWSPSVIHVMMWTGKKVGYGVDDINPDLIAPEEHCPNSVSAPQIGDWVITDSHYQGPDYRTFTSCYYGVNLWGVRRIIGISSS